MYELVGGYKNVQDSKTALGPISNLDKKWGSRLYFIN